MKFTGDGYERDMELRDRFGDKLSVSVMESRHVYIQTGKGPCVQLSKKRWRKLARKIEKELQ